MHWHLVKIGLRDDVNFSCAFYGGGGILCYYIKMIDETEVGGETNNKINESELFRKYKSTYKSAFLDLSLHTFLLSCAFYLEQRAF